MGSQEIKCLLCGSIADLRHPEYPGYKEPDTYSIYHCRHCNTAFSFPRRDASSIYEDIYNNADRVPGYQRYRKYARSAGKFSDPLKYLADTSEVYWGVKEALPLSDPHNPQRVLEIGSGLGYLTYALAKRNFNVTGIDISESAVKKATDTFGDYYKCADIHDYAQQNPGSFDIVISTEVIEHFENITELLDSVMRLLKPGGQAILTTPNKSFFPDDIIWATELPPVHYWWLSEGSMKYIAESIKAGISFVDFRKFFNKNYKVVGLRQYHNGSLPVPFFDNNGELIKGSSGSFSIIKTNLQALFSGIPVIGTVSAFFKRHLKNIFGRLRNHFEKDILVCGERGYILCAIIRKGQ